MKRRVIEMEEVNNRKVSVLVGQCRRQTVIINKQERLEWEELKTYVFNKRRFKEPSLHLKVEE